MERLVRSCTHCGLGCPAGASFCCYGCELVYSLTQQAGDAGNALRGRLVLCAFFAMNLMAVTLFSYSQEIYGATPDGSMARLGGLFRAASFVFATPIIAILGVPLGARAWRGFADGRAGAELLVITGVSVCYAYSLYGLVGGGPLYFDAACMTLILAGAGRFAEAHWRGRAAGLLSARLGRGNGYAHKRVAQGWRRIPVREVAAGDHVRVRAGDEIPADGRVVCGRAEVDNSALTGESQTIAVAAGDYVAAGAIVTGASIEVRATRDATDSTVAQLEELLRNARNDRPHTVRSVDRVAAVLAPAMIAVAIATFVYWTLAGATERGVLAAVSVLVVACPCSFGIATPLAFWAALRRAAECGVYFRSASVLEVLAGARAVVFDKTGTLTETAKSDATVTILDDPDDDVIAYAAALEDCVNHPIASVLRTLVSSAERPPAPSEVRVLAGRGISGRFGDRIMHVGNAEMADSLDLVVDEVDRRPGTVLIIDGRRLAARVQIRAPMRASAVEAIQQLLRRGMHVEILSGDAEAAADAAGRRLLVPARGGQSAADKLERINELTETLGTTVMVGDGTNDAPALARATVGVAIGVGTDLAKAAAPLNLSSSDPRTVAWSLELALATRRIVRQNLAWSFVYNAACVAAAASGHLTPVLAAIAMLGSSFTVVGNSLRLTGFAAINNTQQGAAAETSGKVPVSATVQLQAHA